MNRIHPSALFLGPKAENADTLERLLLEALRDHVFWRRNFHPEDGWTISDHDKRSPGHVDQIDRLSEQLMGLLGELKEGVPFYSPRYIGHMASDLSLASVIGYFAALLYNPNNVSVEASPVTTRLEREVASDLARMVGYPAKTHFGHLTSGGTIANIEALWAAREVKYLPVALRFAAREGGLKTAPIATSGGKLADVRELPLWELLNVTPASAMEAWSQAAAHFRTPEDALAAMSRHTLASLGYQQFGLQLEREFGSTLPPAVVLVPSTAHYSWVKACRALGFGDGQLVRIPVDRQFRMNPEALEAELKTLAAQRRPVLAVVGVLGSTEESAVDPLHLIADALERSRRQLGVSCWFHADAAYGGYAASIVRDRSGAARPYERLLEDAAPEVWPEEGTYRALCAVGATDSVTIDPHKLGYCPYPAGAVVFRDQRVSRLLAVEAPYVFFERDDAMSLGQFVFEGSKPGAAAAAVWMGHRTLPLDGDGHGRLVLEGARAARVLHRRLAGAELAPFKVAMLPAPDLNIVCFAVGHPSLKTLEANNAFVDRIYRQLSAGAGRSARRVDAFITRTELGVDGYGEAVEPYAALLGFGPEEVRRVGGMTVLRSTVMNPFFGGEQGRVPYLELFLDALKRAMEAALL